MIKSLLLTATLIAATTPALGAPGHATIEGNWTNPKHSVTVRIARCGAALCGRVISANAHARAKAAAGGTGRLVGTELMSDLRPAGAGEWRGSVFVPDRNVRADGTLRLVSPRTLEVEGCALGGILCKSQQWTRVASAGSSKRR